MVTQKELDFIEFASVEINGDLYTYFVRKSEHHSTGKENVTTVADNCYTAEIFMVKQNDHFLLKIITDERNDEITLALHDASRFMYFTFTGENCHLEILSVNTAEEPVSENYIPRIAEKISYIDKPNGDIPNIQIDGWMTAYSEITELNKNVNISFHTMSLPSARRVWHCPIIALFTSADGKINGKNYKELAFIRLDGEVWCENTEVTKAKGCKGTQLFQCGFTAYFLLYSTKGFLGNR